MECLLYGSNNGCLCVKLIQRVKFLRQKCSISALVSWYVCRKSLQLNINRGNWFHGNFAECRAGGGHYFCVNSHIIFFCGGCFEGSGHGSTYSCKIDFLKLAGYVLLIVL